MRAKSTTGREAIMTILRLVPLAAAAVLALAGCSSMESGRPLGAALTGANNPQASGQANVSYDPSTKLAKWTVSYSGLSGPATMAHFHGPAGPGANAPPVIWLSPQGQPVPNPIVGEATLNEAQAQQLLGGQWYVNIHTAANPAGEARGQVMAK
jgi:hypothetical protein